MTDRMTEERLAEIERVGKFQHDPFGNPWQRDKWVDCRLEERYELLQALKAERLYAASLEGKLSAADVIEEAQLKRIRELEAKLERVSKLPKKWREDREEQRSVGCRHFCCGVW